MAEPWRERRGVNAARMNWAWSNGGQLTAVAAVDDALENATLGLRPTWNLWQTDLSPVLSLSTESNVFWGRTCVGKGDGWWLEGGGFLGEAGWNTRLSVGLDYSFLLREDGSGERSTATMERESPIPWTTRWQREGRCLCRLQVVMRRRDF